MADGIRLSAAVMFVRDLGASVSFYTEVLGLDVTDSSSTAALLGAASGAQLVLRAFGDNAPHPLGAIGVQYLTWATPSQHDLDRRAAILRRRSAYRETRTSADVTVVEGRDPDDLVVMLMYSGQGGLRELSSRIYAW